MTAQRPDGALFWVISSFKKMFFRKEECIIIGFYDLTERRKFEREILNASENERIRIGQDLHDDICQNMVGIAAISQVIETQLQSLDVEKASP